MSIPSAIRTARNWLSVVVALIPVHAAAKAAPPNIVYIVSDDQSWTDFGFMGNPRVHTPQLDRLAQKSARFVQGYVPSSVCRPSLVTLLTGLYPHQHGIHFNHGPPGNSGYNRLQSADTYHKLRQREFALIKKHPTLPALLRTAHGYRALQTGKFWEGHWRNGGFTEGMTTFAPPPDHQTFGGARQLANGARVAHGNGDAGLQIGRTTMQPIFDFIDDCQADTTPWMVWYAPYLPHQPHDSPERFYADARAKPDVAEHELPYFASIAQFDATVGQLVQFIERRRLAQNTLFVFVVDNGWSPSRRRQPGRPVEFAHTKRSKRAPFDSGLRTPILLRWDGVIEPGTHTQPVSSVDLLPTLLAATGTAYPTAGQLPGMNLLPAARGETPLDTDRAVYGAIYPGDATSLGHPERDVAYRWIRAGRLKLIVPHVQHAASKPWGDHLAEAALFDVVADPHEAQNLADRPKYNQAKAQLQRRLDRWWNPAK